MLIGIDASRVSVGQPTGTENYALSIIRALLGNDIGHRFVLYHNGSVPPGTFPQTPRATIRPIPSPYLWTHFRLGWEVWRRPPDVLFVPAHVVPLACACPPVVTVHDLGYIAYPEAHPTLSRWYLHLGTLYSVKRAAHVIAVSEATRRDLVARLKVPREKITVVPEACPPGFGPPADSARARDAARRYGLGGPYALAIGTVHPRKNLVRLVRAFGAAVTSAGLPHQLAIVGRLGWRAETVRQAVSVAGCAERVVLTGYVPAADLPLLLGAADALLFPSLYEGFGLPALEAMTCGVPVLASNSSSLPEVVGDAGLLVDPLDVEDMANGVAKLLGDPLLRAELGARGIARATHFSWERSARATLRVLEAAASVDTGGALC